MPDPLSIAATVLSLIEVGQKIKDSVDRVGRNRKQLRELSDDVLQGLSDLENFCRTREEVLEESADLKSSLDDLCRQLTYVRERCQKSFPQPTTSRIAAARSGFRAWRKGDSIEADIKRLKEHVQSCHLRFNSFASARIEHNLLVLSTEQRARLHRMEGLVARVLIDSHASGFKAPLFLDDTCRDGIEFQYLHLQIRKIVDALGKAAASQTFAQEEPHESYLSGLELVTNLPPTAGESFRLRATVLRALQIQQLLEAPQGPSYIQDGALALLDLGNLLYDLDLYVDAAAVVTWAVDIYRTLIKGNVDCFVAHLAWALYNLSCCVSGTPEGLVAAQASLATYRTLIETNPCYSYKSCLPRALRSMSCELALNERYEESLACAQESLAVQRQISSEVGYNSWCYIAWDASGEEVLVFTTSRRLRRSPEMAYEEALSLQQLSFALAAVGQYTEACIAGKEAISAFQALAAYCPGPYEGRLNDSLSRHSGWLVLVRSPTDIPEEDLSSS